MFEVITNSPAETRRLGRVLGELAKPGDIICLYGDLGTGKTNLAQGVAEGLGITGRVTSPTFTLINEYQGRHPLYHMDAYRLGGPDDMVDLGYEEYFYGDGVTLIEWANIISAVLPGERLDLQLTKDGETKRIIKFVPAGSRYVIMVEELLKIVRAGD